MGLLAFLGYHFDRIGKTREIMRITNKIILMFAKYFFVAWSWWLISTSTAGKPSKWMMIIAEINYQLIWMVCTEVNNMA